MEKDLISATSKYVRTSPRKVAMVIDMVRGKKVLEAIRILTFNPTKAAKLILKTVKSAKANAENNFSKKEETLVVSKAMVDGGPMLKRGRIVGRSRVSPILKRTSHIFIGLTEEK